jgi:hypothetical protein
MYPIYLYEGFRRLVGINTQQQAHLKTVTQHQARRRSWQTAALLGILVLGLALRLWGIGWGLPDGHRRAVSYHPDENTYLWQIATMNPAEGDFVIDVRGMAVVSYILAALLKAADVVGWLELQPSEDFYIAHPEEAAKMYLLGRAISIVSGMLSIVLIYLIVRKTFTKAPWWLAPLGALLLAVAPGHVINCHYLETDLPVTLFVLLTVYWMVDLVQRGRLRDYVLVGIGTGLAIGTKWSALLLLPLALIAHCMRQSVWWRPTTIFGKEQFKRLLVLGLSLVLVFFLTNPYTALHPIEVTRSAGNTGSALFADARNKTFAVGLAKLSTEILPTSLSWGLYLLGGVGLLTVLMDRRRATAETLAAAWVLIFGTVVANARRTTVGRTLPLTPFFIILTISALVRLRAWARGSRPKLAAAVTLVALSVCLAVGMSIVADLFFCCSDTARQEASRWIAENVPSGATFGLYNQEPYWDDPDILYQDFYHPTGTGPQYQYEIYPLDADELPQPDSDYLIFTQRDAKNMHHAALLHWMEEHYEVVAEFESTVHILGLEFHDLHRYFGTPHIQILRLKESE